jgi:hypothetical protein
MNRLCRLARVCIPLAAVLGCEAFESTLTTPPPQTELVIAPDFDTAPPVEIAVLPVRRPLAFGEAEGQELLDELYGELLRKNYTPLNPDYVAARLPQPFAVDGLPDVGTLGKAVPADAYLMVDLHKADLEQVDGARPRYRLDATAFVFEATTGRELYRHELNLTYDVRLDGSRLLPGNQRREKLKLFAGRLLTRVPVRRVR